MTTKLIQMEKFYIPWYTNRIKKINLFFRNTIYTLLTTLDIVLKEF